MKSSYSGRTSPLPISQVGEDYSSSVILPADLTLTQRRFLGEDRLGLFIYFFIDLL